MIAPVIIAAGIAAAGSVASAAMSKGGGGGGDIPPAIDQTSYFWGGEKTINFGGSLRDSLLHVGIGAAVVVAIAWLKKAKGKK